MSASKNTPSSQAKKESQPARPKKSDAPHTQKQDTTRARKVTPSVKKESVPVTQIRTRETAAQRKTEKQRQTSVHRETMPQREIDVPNIARKPRTPLYAEMALWIVLAFCVILILSNFFGIGGSIGNALSRFFFGIFGMIAYLFPFLLFLLTAFLVANRGSLQAWSKAAAAVVMMICMCTFCELAVNSFDSARTFVDYYQAGSELRVGGGIAGGLLCRSFCPIFGKVGAWILTIALTVIGAIAFTEHSMFDSIRKSSSRAVTNARTNSSMRRELHDLKRKNQQLERQRRMQNEIERVRDTNEGLQLEIREPRRVRRVSGVSEATTLDTALPASEELHEVVPKKRHTAAVVRTDEPMSRAKQARLASEAGDNRARRMVDSVSEETKAAQLDMNFTIQRGGTSEQVATKKTAVATPVRAELSLEKETSGSAFHLPDTKLRVERSVTAEKKGAVPAQEEREASSEEAAPAEGSKGPIRNPRSSKQEQEQALNSVAQEIEQAETKEKRTYVYPPVSLLSRPRGGSGGNTDDEVKQTAAKLQQTLHNFGVNVTITNVSCGPAVTRYELMPEQGVKVSRIVNLSDDIKLNLAAADIRIEAPIPGKPAVGIEVPNKENSAVMLRELIESDEFQNAESKLSFAVGKDIAGKVVVADIAKMPHLLIAGATGSGKSVCINTLIMSILYKADPEEVKLIMIDPKVVELSVYNGIPHLFIPVVTDPKKASGALNWGVAEMTDRYAKFADCGVRDLKGYNAKAETLAAAWDRQNEAAGGTMDRKTRPRRLPQIVIIVDELADLMMVAPGEVEDSICRLAQLARAAGIHLIIATQRPSVNVITGLIKANMPSRVAFSVTSGVDSRTILDMQGAEKLLGKGDMLFYPQGYQKPVRVQGAFVSDNEVSAVTDFLTNKNDVSAYHKDMEERIGQVQQAAGMASAAAGGGSEFDTNFAEAGRFIIDKDKASIGMLQRVFKIGFNRAARIMDQLSDAGVVGPEEGTKPRKVLMSMEEFEQYVEEHV